MNFIRYESMGDALGRRLQDQYDPLNHTKHHEATLKMSVLIRVIPFCFVSFRGSPFCP
jgi:hypothetical protein